MKENVILKKSYSFALKIVSLYKNLSGDYKEFVLSKQVLRSGTSIGANMHEADAAISKAEFSAKVSIAYKEARETQYWLRLLFDSNYLNQNQFDSLFNESTEICKILFSILKTTGRIRKQ